MDYNISLESNQKNILLLLILCIFLICACLVIGGIAYYFFTSRTPDRRTDPRIDPKCNINACNSAMRINVDKNSCFGPGSDTTIFNNQCKDCPQRGFRWVDSNSFQTYNGTEWANCGLDKEVCYKNMTLK